MGPFDINQLEIAETEVATCIFPECVKLSRKKITRNRFFFCQSNQVDLFYCKSLLHLTCLSKESSIGHFQTQLNLKWSQIVQNKFKNCQRLNWHWHYSWFSVGGKPRGAKSNELVEPVCAIFPPICANSWPKRHFAWNF